MRGWSTELKVGLLILAGSLSLSYASILVTGWQPGGGESYTINAYLDDAGGLLVGSPVQVAGVKIGQVEAIQLEGRRARVRLSIFTRYTLRADASVEVKSLGILGDKLINIQPGSESAIPLQDGDTIALTLPGASLDNLVDNLGAILNDLRSVTAALRNTLGGEAGEERLESILNSTNAATRDLARITATAESRLGGILSNLSSFSHDLQGLGAENRTAIGSIVENLDYFTSDLRGITTENRERFTQILRNLDIFLSALATDGPQITADLRALITRNKQELEDTLGNLNRSFQRLERTLANTESISGKLDRGEGSLGKLINDETTVDELNSALSGLNRFLSEAQRIRLDLGGSTEYLSRQGVFKSYFDIRIQPLRDRYYLIQLVDNPRGKVSQKTVKRTTDGTLSEIKETEIQEDFQFTLLIAQRYYDTEFRGGLIESKFGMGVSQHFGSEDQYRIGLDVWDFDNEAGAHVKISALWKFYSNAFLVVGGDDLASDDKKLRDAFFGIGLHFNEDSLKPLLGSLPAP